MATVGASYLTFTDLLGRMNPDGSMATIIEAADNENEFIRSALMMEGNDITGHTSVSRTGLPVGTRRTLYGGVPVERSRTEKVRDAVSTLASYSEIDAEEVDMAPNPVQYRADEDASFFSGFTQSQETDFFDGDSDADPLKFHGLNPRYANLTGNETSANVIGNGGSGSDNTSIYLVTWHPQTLFLFYGKGTRAGFQMMDKGLETIAAPDGNGNMEAWRTYFEWKLGLAMPDWRYTGRLCNIDASDRDAGTFGSLRDNLIRLINLPPTNKGLQVLYMNKLTKVGLDILASTAAAGLSITIEDFFGRPTEHIQGRPIIIADVITDTQATIA